MSSDSGYFVTSMAEASARDNQDFQSIRETVESIGVATILALVLRAFMIEAFVIPTGSMADGLMGEHWDIRCPACGYEYAYGWPGRAGPASGAPVRGARATPNGARCPRCSMPFSGGDEHRRYVNSGDRILVLKYLYNFSPPRPWDVVVFKNPQDNRENYIKRLIGLPGEQIEIVHGDVFFRRSDNEKWRIRRKTPKAQKAMWHVIFDSDYQPDPNMIRQANERLRGDDRIRPRSWRPLLKDTRWDLTAGGRAFSFSGNQTLDRMRADRIEFVAGRNVFLPYYGYNSLRSVSRDRRINHNTDVSSDLKLSAVFTPIERDAAVELLLTSFEHCFRANFDAAGNVQLVYQKAGQPPTEWGKIKLPPFELGRGRELALVHVDLSVAVCVDGKVVLKVDDQRFPENYATLYQRLQGQSDFKMPVPEVQIVAAGGKLELRHVRLMRDVFYTQPSLGEIPDGPEGNYARGDRSARKGLRAWAAMDNPIKLSRHTDDPAKHDLDEFFVLGDNSPASLDGRLWLRAAPSLRLFDEDDNRQYQLGTVPRYNMIGKAIFVYWPSGFRTPGLPQWPLLPNVGRMRMIR